MTDPIEDTQVWSPEDVDAIKRDVEEEDETGAPEKVAWPDRDDAQREPPHSSDVEQDRAPQPGLTPDVDDH